MPRLCLADLASSIYLSMLGLQGGRELLQLSSVLPLQCCRHLGSNKGSVRDAGQGRLAGQCP